jgi:hypothetical protein
MPSAESEPLDAFWQGLAALREALDTAGIPRRPTLRLVDPFDYYEDAAVREAMPCSECGKTGGCEHFPKVVGNDG